MIVRQKAYARAGLIGNPSDGYHGKTLAFTFGDFFAEVVLYESPELELRPNPLDQSVYDSLEHLYDSVQRNGYYGGIRLLRAAVKKFIEHCRGAHISLDDRNFTCRYTTNIPRQVGLGGSSAIITAVMKALIKFYEVEVPNDILANVVLAAETEELGLTAGLQDRVIQAYGGLVYMDFDEEYMDEHGYGRYEPLPPDILPPVYIAYRDDLAEESSLAHINVRQRYMEGDKTVVRTMSEIASLADVARELMEQRKYDELSGVIDRNFDLRARIYPIRSSDRRMVETARSVGASCKFCGSGGAVVGTYDGKEMLSRLQSVMRHAGYQFITPQAAPEAAKRETVSSTA
jgi:glucuronokinase